MLAALYEQVVLSIAGHIWLLMGTVLLLGWSGGKLIANLRLPSVVGYILVGLILGPSGVHLFHEGNLAQLGLLSELVLALVAFTIGTELTLDLGRRMGKKLLFIILGESFGAFVCVFALVYLLTGKLHYALIFAAMAPASAPAGTVVVLQEYRAMGPLTDLLLAVVGLDDGLAIMIYAFAGAMAKSFLAGQHSFALVTAILLPLVEIGGSILLGVAVGLLLALTLRKLRTKADILTITLSALIFTTGMANYLHLSLILANLVVGMMVVNLYPKGTRKSFELINQMTPPFYVVFFVLAGAHLELQRLPAMGMLGILYILGRTTGKFAGAYTGCVLSQVQPPIRSNIGLGILSQAGVAIGLALMVSRQFMSLGPQGQELAIWTINTITATTIVFEILGPVGVKMAITRAGEAGQAREF